MQGVFTVASVNVNGIRAAHRRGYSSWQEKASPDVVALQEVRCSVADLPAEAFADYHLSYDPGSIAGRNGVAVLTRTPPLQVRTWGAPALLRAPDQQHHDLTDLTSTTLARGLAEFSTEGRYIEVDLADRPVTVANLYLPKGGLPAHLQKPERMREAPDGGAKYQRKMRFLDAFARQLHRSRRAALAAGREFLLLGDLNVAHAEVDVANWRRSKQAEGFLPEERAWIGAQLSPRTLIDVVRRLHPDTAGPYSWWSWMGNSFANDIGWRIDYQLATPALARSAVAARVDRDTPQRVSDHAPVVVDYDL